MAVIHNVLEGDIKTVSNTLSGAVENTNHSINGSIRQGSGLLSEWGKITGTIANQTDLMMELNEKADLNDIPTKVSDLQNDSGFVTSANIPNKVSDLANDSGFITGINSTMVTNALGFTPYSDANPSGFTNDSALTEEDIDEAIT